MNNADFDTLFMTPRPRPAPQRRGLPTPPKTPKPRQRQPNSPKPLLTAHLPRQPNDSSLSANARNLPDVQEIRRQIKQPPTSFQKSHTPLVKPSMDGGPVGAVACSPVQQLPTPADWLLCFARLRQWSRGQRSPGERPMWSGI
jgi:hypothetical protein